MPTDWELRYQTKDMPWEKGAPAPGLVDFLAAHPDVPRGSVLVPGCGTGHDAREFAKAGFEVTGFDVAPSAVRLSTERTQMAGLNARFVRDDFLKDGSASRFDWLFEHTLFCAIEPCDRNRYVSAVIHSLKPDGYFLAIQYLIPDRDGPPFGTDRDEIWQRFSPHFDLLEEWVPRSYPNRTGLERMFWWQRKRAE